MATTFKHQIMHAYQSGDPYHVLEAAESPYTVCQVVTFDPEKEDTTLAILRTRGGWIEQAPGRHDFAVIHAGGGRKVTITPANQHEIMAQLHQQLRDAAQYWADHGPEFTT